MKTDPFQAARGGYGELLALSCSKCEAQVGHYQKDGPGPLLRLYVDRLSGAPAPSFAEGRELSCPQCGFVLGLGIIYVKERRPAWRLFQGSIRKRPTRLLRHLLCLARGVLQR